MASTALATNPAAGSSLVEALSSLSTFVGRMKALFHQWPVCVFGFLFDFHIRLGPLEAPAVPNSPTQYIEDLSLRSISSTRHYHLGRIRRKLRAGER